MIFTIIKTSTEYKGEQQSIEINTLEELLAFRDKTGHAIILLTGTKIEIYDDYRE